MDLIQIKKEFIYKIADDLLILGHRNSEWTGLGPILEEDIAFSSMAQDKIGQAAALYEVLHTWGESEPDMLGFMRNASQMHNCQFAEWPIGSYAFSLMRHFLFDHAIQLRIDALVTSSDPALAKLALKYRGETKYHVFHANTWVKQLGLANEEANGKMQEALNECWNLALGIFEPGPKESFLIEEGIFPGEEWLRNQWLETVVPLLEQANLKVPNPDTWNAIVGGRIGNHSKNLQPLLDEMTEVYKIDPSAEW